MMKLAKAIIPASLAAAAIVLGTATVSWAGHVAPEVDPSSGVAALALVGGAVLLIRGRLKK